MDHHWLLYLYARERLHELAQQAADQRLRMEAKAVRESQRRLLSLGLLTSDALMLIIAFTIAYWLRFSAQVTLAPEIVPSITFYSRLIAMLLPMWLTLFFLSRLYDYQTLLGGTEEYVRAINAISSGMMLVVLASFIEPLYE